MIGPRQLQQFIAVAEARSFRLAAKRLHMSQPPLSVAIRRLEETLGVTLLERSKGLAPTASGLAFLHEARLAVAQIARAVDAAKRADTLLSGTLRLGFVDSTVSLWLPRILRHFQAHHPQVEVQLMEAIPPEQVKALHHDAMDVGMLVLPLFEAHDLHLEKLLREEMVIALPGGHPLAARPSVELAALAHEAWILFAPHHGPGMHARILTACAAAGFTPRVVQQPRQMQTTAALVAAGMGVALMPRLYAPLHSGDIVFREIGGSGTPIPYEIALAWRHSNLTVEAFRQTAMATVAEYAAGTP